MPLASPCDVGQVALGAGYFLRTPVCHQRLNVNPGDYEEQERDKPEQSERADVVVCANVQR
jgi:hypothetical protein